MSKNDCNNAGEAKDDEMDGDGDVGEAVVREGHVDDELQEKGGRNAEDGDDDEPRERLQQDVGVDGQRR